MLQIFNKIFKSLNKEKTEVMNLGNSDVSADVLKIEGLKKGGKKLLNRSGSFSRIGTGEVSP